MMDTKLLHSIRLGCMYVLLMLAFFGVNIHDCFGLFLQDLSIVSTDSISLDPSVDHGTLDNGLTYYIRNTGKSSGIVEVRFVIKVGFQCETSDELEISHIIEHAAFGNTKHFSNVVDYLDRRGLQIGRDYGANTGISSTSYWFKVPVHDTKLLFDCLQLIRDWNGNIVFDSANIDRERRTVLSEIVLPRNRDNVVEKAESRMLGNSEFRRDPRAVEANVRTFHQKTLVNFYRRWYTPDLQAVIVVGDVNVTSIRERIQSLYSDAVTKKNLSHRVTVNSENEAFVSSVQPQVIVDLDNESNKLVVQEFWRKPTFLRISKEAWKKEVMVDIFNEMIQHRLQDFTCSSQESSVTVGTIQFKRSCFPAANQDALYAASFLPKGSRGKRLEGDIRRALLAHRAVLARPFSALELASAKERVLSKSPTIDSIRVATIGYEMHYLKKEIFLGFPGQTAIRSGLVREVTLEETNKMVEIWLKTSSDIILSGFESGDDLPEERRVIRIAQQSMHARRAMEDMVIAKRLSLSLVPAATLVSDVHDYTIQDSPVTDSRYITLANGARIILRKFAPNGENSSKIALEAFRHGGASRYGNSEYYSALCAAGIASVSDLKGVSRDELNEYFKCRDMRIHPFVSDKYIGFRGESTPEDLASLIQVLRLTFNPVMTNKSLSAYIKQINDFLPREYTVYDSIVGLNSANKGLLENLNGTLATRLNVNSAKRIYRELFTDMQDFTFLVTGDFDVDMAQRLLTSTLSTFKSSPDIRPEVKNVVLWEEKSGHMQDQAFQILQNGSENKRIIALYFFENGPNGLGDRLERKVFCSVLNTMLYQKLRWEMGSAYFVSVSDDQLVENRYRITIWIDTSYEDTGEMIAAIWEQIEKISKDGADPVIVRTEVERQITNFRNEMSEHSFWKNYFQTQCLSGGDFDEIQAWENEYRRINSEDLQILATRLLENIQLFKLSVQG